MEQITIRALLFQSGQWWIAQCLEYDLATAAKRLEDLPAELERFLTVQIAGSLEIGVEPFEGIPPAPRRFWRRHEEAQQNPRSALEERQIMVNGSPEIGATVQALVAA